MFLVFFSRNANVTILSVIWDRLIVSIESVFRESLSFKNISNQIQLRNKPSNNTDQSVWLTRGQSYSLQPRGNWSCSVTHPEEDKAGLEPDSRHEGRDALPRGLKQTAATSLHGQMSSASVPAEDRGREGSQGATETSRRDAAAMPASARFGGASPRSACPHPGPLRRGQQRSSPGLLCPAPGPQPRSHGNQVDLRCTPARTSVGACARSHASPVPAGERSCRRTFRVAPAKE